MAQQKVENTRSSILLLHTPRPNNTKPSPFFEPRNADTHKTQAWTGVCKKKGGPCKEKWDKSQARPHHTT